MQIDYSQEILSHWSLIDRLAKRRFNESLAEEAALYVLNRLQEDECRRVRAFSGQTRLSTFLSSLVLRLLEDFSRMRFGRLRPPQWISALGGIWVTVFELLCLQRQTISDAVEMAMQRLNDRQQLEQIAYTILERVTDCGKHQAMEVEFDESRAEPQNERPGRKDRLENPEERFLQEERRIFLEVLFTALLVGKEHEQAAEQASVKIFEVQLSLSAEERLLLKLCYQDGVSVARAGKMLGLNVNQVHGRLRRLLSRLRESFEQAGVYDELRLLLEDI